jgi:predicted amino acid racemase
MKTTFPSMSTRENIDLYAISYVFRGIPNIMINLLAAGFDSIVT